MTTTNEAAPPSTVPLAGTVAPPGLKGLVVADTAIGDVRGAEGFYHYRQHDAVELARTRTVEDVWQLVLDGALPLTPEEREAFAARVRGRRVLPPEVLAVLPAIAEVASPLDGLRSALPLLGSALGLRPLLDTPPPARREAALQVSAAVPTLLAALHRLRHGLEPVAPRDDLGAGASWLWLLTGEEPDPRLAAAIETYLVLTVDHGFNASTFTARVVASTGADLVSAVVAASGALSGPLHGGAPSRALELLDEIGPPHRTDEVVRAALDRGDRLMGFGHAVYRTDDPRSVLLREVARSLAQGSPAAAARVDAVEQVEARVVELLEQHRSGRALRANVELYAAVVMDLCGVPRQAFTPTFTVSRVIGWCAHALEQAETRQIIRPAARYVGPPPPVPVPPV